MDISVIIAVYNDEKHIERAIRSCLNQTIPHQDYEIIVVDDGSTDSTPAILSDFEKWLLPDWVRVITLPENKGVGYASNQGIRAAKGQFVVRVDSDDYVNEHLLFIERMYLINNKEMTAIACDYLIVDEDERVLGRQSPIQLPIACGVMFRKDKLIDVGLYKEMRIGEERDLFHRFVEKYGIYRIALPLYRYYQSANSITKKNEELWQRIDTNPPTYERWNEKV